MICDTTQLIQKPLNSSFGTNLAIAAFKLDEHLLVYLFEHRIISYCYQSEVICEIPCPNSKIENGFIINNQHVVVLLQSKKFVIQKKITEVVNGAPTSKLELLPKDFSKNEANRLTISVYNQQLLIVYTNKIEQFDPLTETYQQLDTNFNFPANNQSLLVKIFDNNKLIIIDLQNNAVIVKKFSIATNKLNFENVCLFKPIELIRSHSLFCSTANLTIITANLFYGSCLGILVQNLGQKYLVSFCNSEIAEMKINHQPTCVYLHQNFIDDCQIVSRSNDPLKNFDFETQKTDKILVELWALSIRSEKFQFTRFSQVEVLLAESNSHQSAKIQQDQGQQNLLTKNFVNDISYNVYIEDLEAKDSNLSTINQLNLKTIQYQDPINACLYSTESIPFNKAFQHYIDSKQINLFYSDLFTPNTAKTNSTIPLDESWLQFLQENIQAIMSSPNQSEGEGLIHQTSPLNPDQKETFVKILYDEIMLANSGEFLPAFQQLFDICFIEEDSIQQYGELYYVKLIINAFREGTFDNKNNLQLKCISLDIIDIYNFCVDNLDSTVMEVLVFYLCETKQKQLEILQKLFEEFIFIKEGGDDANLKEFVSSWIYSIYQGLDYWELDSYEVFDDLCKNFVSNLEGCKLYGQQSKLFDFEVFWQIGSEYSCDYYGILFYKLKITYTLFRKFGLTKTARIFENLDFKTYKEEVSEEQIELDTKNCLKEFLVENCMEIITQEHYQLDMLNKLNKELLGQLELTCYDYFERTYNILHQLLVDFNQTILKKMIDLGKVEIFSEMNLGQLPISIKEFINIIIKNISTENYENFKKVCIAKPELENCRKIVELFGLMKQFGIYLTIQLFAEYSLEDLLKKLIREIIFHKFNMNLHYDGENYPLSNIRKFWEIIEKIDISLYGLRLYLAEIKYLNVNITSHDWFENKDAKTIVVSEFSSLGMYCEIGKLLKIFGSFNYAEIDKELQDDLCFKVLKNSNSDFEIEMLNFVTWKSVRYESLKMVFDVMRIIERNKGFDNYEIMKDTLALKMVNNIWNNKDDNSGDLELSTVYKKIMEYHQLLKQLHDRFPNKDLEYQKIDNDNFETKNQEILDLYCRKFDPMGDKDFQKFLGRIGRDMTSSFDASGLLDLSCAMSGNDYMDECCNLIHTIQSSGSEELLEISKEIKTHFWIKDLSKEWPLYKKKPILLLSQYNLQYSESIEQIKRARFQVMNEAEKLTTGKYIFSIKKRWKKRR